MKPVVIIATWGRATVQPAEGETIMETVNNFIMDTKWCPSDYGTNIIVDTEKGIREFMFYRPSGRHGAKWSTLEVIHATKN
jgi:hypothetical protein